MMLYEDLISVTYTPHKVLSPFSNCMQTLIYHAPTCFFLIISSDMLSMRNLVLWTNPIRVPSLEKTCSDPTKLISTYYAALNTDCNPRFWVDQTKWSSLDIPLSQRQTGLNLVIHISPQLYPLETALSSLRFFIILTLLLPSYIKWGCPPSAEYFRGCGQAADFIHCFWTCPMFRTFV